MRGKGFCVRLLYAVCPCNILKQRKIHHNLREKEHCMKCTGLYGTPDKVQADVHIVFFPDDETAFKKICDRIIPSHKAVVLGLRSKGDFVGKDTEVLQFIAGENRFILAGLGNTNEFNRHSLRSAAARAAREAKKFVAQSIAIHIPLQEVGKKQHLSFEDMVETATEGALLGLYKFDKYITRNRDDRKGQIRELKIVTSDEGFQGTLKTAIDTVYSIFEGVELARDLTNAPSNEIHPDALAREARAIAKRFNLKIIVLGKKEIEAHKMGGLLAVNRGSEMEPRFIVMEYNTMKRKGPLYALVGKGVTFDSGGLSIKPASSMEEMKMDMAGAAAVLGTMLVAAKLKLGVRIVGIIPATDNKTGGNAICPGDIITMSNGTTVEILNTDAEGRLILADALVYAQRYKPDGIIDIATLTGACVVALASHATGMMGTGEALKSGLIAAGEKTRERVWELPLFPEYEKMIKGSVSDLKNVGSRWGGAITAAAFLKAFVGAYPWVHLDIAGTAMLEESTELSTKGASGVSVRLLTEFFRAANT